MQSNEHSTPCGEEKSYTNKRNVFNTTTFLTWVAEPEMEARKGMGAKVMIFLVLLTVLLYLVKRKVWRDLN